MRSVCGNAAHADTEHRNDNPYPQSNHIRGVHLFILNHERLTAPAGRAVPPPREAPMLAAPRALLAWALALLDAPPKALVFRDASLLESSQLPILFPPLLLRFAPLLLRPPLRPRQSHFARGD